MGVGVQREGGVGVAQDSGVLASTPLVRAWVAKVCPYGIITTNRKSPRISRVFGYLARFFILPNRKIKPRSDDILGGCYSSDKMKYRLDRLSARPRNQDLPLKEEISFLYPNQMPIGGLRCRRKQPNRAGSPASRSRKWSSRFRSHKAASVPGSPPSGAGGCVMQRNRRKC